MPSPQRPNPAATGGSRRPNAQNANAPLAPTRITQPLQSVAPKFKSKGSIGNLLSRFRFGSKANEQTEQAEQSASNDDNGYARAYAQGCNSGYAEGYESPPDPSLDIRRGRFLPREENVMGPTGMRGRLGHRDVESEYSLNQPIAPSLTSSTSYTGRNNFNQPSLASSTSDTGTGRNTLHRTQNTDRSGLANNFNPPSLTSSTSYTDRNTLPRSQTTNRAGLQDLQTNNRSASTSSLRLPESRTTNTLNPNSRTTNTSTNASSANHHRGNLHRSTTAGNVSQQSKPKFRTTNGPLPPSASSILLPPHLPTASTAHAPQRPSTQTTKPTTFELTPLSALIAQSHADIAALRQLHRIQAPAATSSKSTATPAQLDFDRLEANLRSFEELYKQHLRYGGGFGGEAEEVCLVALVCKRGDVVRGRVKGLGLGLEAEVGGGESDQREARDMFVGRVPDCGL